MNIEQEIQALKDRNSRVEADKAWETSFIRAGVIALITYVVAGVTLQLIGAVKPWLTAFVPALGWILSTLTLTPLKKWWMRKQ